MSRRTKRRNAPARPPAPKRSALPWRALVVVGLLLVAVLVGFAVARIVRERQQAALASVVERAQTAREALRLEDSLPLFQRALAMPGGDAWSVHGEYADALSELTLLDQRRAGILQPRTRSSIERVAFGREALAQYEVAAREAPTPQARAAVFRRMAELEFAWGMMWDAYRHFREAQSADPLDASLAHRADQFQMLLQHPERFATTEESMKHARQANGLQP